MNTVDKNTPAFPTTEEHGFNSGSPGMTLRDHFAGQALVGLMGRNWSNVKYDDDAELMAIWAKNAYVVADFMMEARSASGETSE